MAWIHDKVELASNSFVKNFQSLRAKHRARFREARFAVMQTVPLPIQNPLTMKNLVRRQMSYILSKAE